MTDELRDFDTGKPVGNKAAICALPDYLLQSRNPHFLRCLTDLVDATGKHVSALTIAEYSLLNTIAAEQFNSQHLAELAAGYTPAMEVPNER